MVTKKSLKKKADKVFSLWIRHKFGYCQLKGLDSIRCSSQLQNMHIESRGRLGIRYNPKNALCGCSGHHVWYTFHPSDFDALVKKHFPKQWKYVEAHKNIRANYMIEDYQKIIKKFAIE